MSYSNRTNNTIHSTLSSGVYSNSNSRHSHTSVLPPPPAASASASTQSRSLQTRIEAKRAELQSLQQLRDLSADLAGRLAALEQKLGTLRDGTQSVALVLANWDNVLRAISMAAGELPMSRDSGSQVLTRLQQKFLNPQTKTKMKPKTKTNLKLMPIQPHSPSLSLEYPCQRPMLVVES